MTYNDKYDTMIYMIRNNNTNRKEKTMLHLDKIVASKMIKNLTNESDKIKDMGRVLTDMGKSYVERNYHLNVDEDFIPDVLAHYNTPLTTEYGFFLAAR